LFKDFSSVIDGYECEAERGLPFQKRTDEVVGRGTVDSCKWLVQEKQLWATGKHPS
jgi:hypothetical protein